jgi:hypothetical protein
MLEQLLRQLALGQPDADKPDWMATCTLSSFGELSVCVQATYLCQVKFCILGWGGEALFY